MARPKPRILFDSPRGYKTDQILYADSIYILTYNDRPVNYRIVDLLTNKIQYPKTTSVHRANIKRLADELNTLHNTTGFAIKEMK